MSDFQDLQFSEAGGHLRVAILPGSVRPPLDVDTLRQLVVQAGYGEWFVFEVALTTVVARYNSPPAAVELEIAERRDGSFSLEVSPNAMTAWINFVPAYAGKAVTPDEIFAALGEAGITFGIDPAVVEQLCREAKHQRLVVATGLAAENGTDTRFEVLVADTRDRVPQVNAQGLIDFRELGAIPLVVAEQPLMRRIPPTAGVGGTNVRGEAVEPTPGRNEAFSPNLIGAYIASDDPNLLLAVFNGQPVRCGNGVMVEQVLHLGDVNVATGNISFDGTVHVNGEVLPGMKVHATGDIVVTGVVDGAVLDAGGDIHVGGGIISQAKVRAGGSVTARFVENGHVYAGTTITVEDMALQSDLQAINQIVIGIKAGERGRLVGGSARAMLLIKTPVLGAAAGGVTSVLLGVNPELEAKYQDLLHRLEKQKQEEANLEKLVKHLSTHEDKGGMLERVKASWHHAVEAWGALLPERDALEREMALIAGARLEVGVGVVGAVDIHFGKKNLRVRQNLDAGVFSVDGEHIVFSPPGKASKAH